MKIILIGFSDTLTRRERIAGLVYLPIHIFVLPIAVGVLAYFALESSLFSDYFAKVPNIESFLTSLTNAVYYGLGFFFCIIVMYRFMRRSFDILLDNFVQCFIGMVSAYLIYYFLSIMISVALSYFFGEAALSNPNDESIASSLDSSGMGTMFALAVFIAPVVEEVLFRGVIFGSLRKKSRALAYVVSILIFGVYHIWQYSLEGFSWMHLVYLLHYVPAGYALARCYERTNSIWPPIFLHILNNAMALSGI